MQEKRIQVRVFLIAALITGAAVLFAWERSRAPRKAEPTAGLQADAVFDWRVTGPAVFAEDCSGCHPDGRAVGKAIPSLRGHAAIVDRSEASRQYLVELLLRGDVQRPDGTEEQGAHPTYPDASDERLAAVLNHMLTAWGNDRHGAGRPEPYTADEIRRRRAGS